MRHSDVVFMYGPKSPDLYDAYGTTAVLWSGGKEAAKEARARGVHYQGSIWFLTAWGDRLAEDPELLKAVCVDIEGKPVEVPWLTDHRQKLPNYWGCTNAPHYRDYIKRQAIEAVQGDFAGLHIDDHCGTSACASYAGGCFCKHCISGFRLYLKERYTEKQLAAMGVQDVETFDYAVYVRQFAQNRQEYIERRFSIPLYMAFMNFQARAGSAFVAEVRVVAEKAAGRSLTLSANCGLPSPLHLADYQHLDILCSEIDLHASAGRPSGASHLAYKVADAIRRPLAATASGWDWAWIAAQDKPGLVKTWVAESYAFGHRLMAPHHQWAYTSEKGTHWWDGQTGDFAPLYKYIATHRKLFDGFEPVSDVVLIFNSPAAYRGQGHYADVAAFLASNNIQYRVAMAGGDWVDERLSSKDLRSARQVVVTTQELLDADQSAVLTSLEKSGKLIAWQGPSSCQGKLLPNVRVQGAENVWAILRANAQTGEVAIHLLNRSFALDQDRTTRTGRFTVTMDGDILKGRHFRSAVLHSIPDGSSTGIRIISDSKQTAVDIPELDLWGVVILKP